MDMKLRVRIALKLNKLANDLDNNTGELEALGITINREPDAITTLRNLALDLLGYPKDGEVSRGEECARDCAYDSLQIISSGDGSRPKAYLKKIQKDIKTLHKMGYKDPLRNNGKFIL